MGVGVTVERLEVVWGEGSLKNPSKDIFNLEGGAKIVCRGEGVQRVSPSLSFPIKF